MRRAANSIAANIAEGHGREVTGSFITICACPRFVDGIGNRYSFLTASVCSARLNFRKMTEKCDEIRGMIRALIGSLQEKQ
ncbi:four helix bundle protein [Rhizobium mongolense]|uniref:four helix bundle protein n=1 Tax=Rhizobium mongolense TaxID=57676 RepID=UPI000B86C90E